MVRKAFLFLALTVLSTMPFMGSFVCKRHKFVQERWIKLNMKASDLTVQDIQFEFPSFIGPRRLNIKGPNRVVIDVKNYGRKHLRVHVAIALFDASGNLVGCGTTGSKLGSTGPNETETYYVVFDYVKSRLSTAEYFYLTVETEPAF